MKSWLEDRSRPGRRLVGAALIALAALGIPVATSHAEGSDGSGFVATASANGGRFTFTVPAFAIIEDVIDGGGPVAQSVVDSFGGTGFASMPYPGDVAIAGPALFQVVTGQPFPGAYPFYVRASHPTVPSGEMKDPTGAYALRATAAEKEASAVAQLRGQGGQGQSGGGGGTNASTSTVEDGDKITATAETVNEALNLGEGALRIASVRSRSTTTYVGGRAVPTTSTELSVDGGSVGNYTFGFGPEGLVVAQQGIPLPGGIGLQQLNTALAPTGISIRFTGVQPLAGGAAADALEITMQQKSPTPGVPGAIVRLRFGAAATSVVVGGRDFSPPVAAGGTEGASEGTFGAMPGPQPGGVSPIGAGPSADATAGSRGGVAYPGVDSAAGSGIYGQVGESMGGGGRSLGGDRGGLTSAASPSQTSPILVAQPIAGQSLRLESGSLLYAVLAAGGFSILMVAWFWRRKGVLPT